MGDVVHLAPPAIAWWNCGCGCTSFHARSDGAVECCNCGTVQDSPDLGAWVAPVTFDGEAPPADPHAVRVVDTAFGSRRLADRIAAGEFDYVVAIKNDGAVSTSGPQPETDEQYAWLARRLMVARQLLCGEPVS